MWKDINEPIVRAYNRLKWLEDNPETTDWRQKYQLALDDLDCAKRNEAKYLGTQRGTIVYFCPLNKCQNKV